MGLPLRCRGRDRTRSPTAVSHAVGLCFNPAVNFPAGSDRLVVAADLNGDGSRIWAAHLW